MTTPSEAWFEHGFAMKPGGWAPGYCWCGKWGYDQPARTIAGQDLPASRGCDALAELIGHRVASHEEAHDGFEAAMGRWDDLEDPQWTQLRDRWRARAAITPARVRELAAAAEDLAGRLALVQAQLGHDGEQQRRAGFRLEHLGGLAGEIATGLHDTASDLARIAATPTDGCAIPWGVCPEHGNALSSSGGETWCRQCSRRWGYDRGGMPCGEPVTHTVTDAEGTCVTVCAGHALSVRAELVGAVVEPIEPIER